MQIFIDNSKLDFKLEEEKTLIEVIEAVSRWLMEENYYISGLSVDGTETDYTDRDILSSLKIDSINEVRITAESFLELKLAQLDAIQHYFMLILNNITAGDRESLVSVLDDYKNIKPLLKTNIDKVYDKNTGFIENFLENISEIDNHFREISIFSENIIIIAETRKNEIISPETELEALKKSFEKTAEDAGNVSILLQTGRDREAMNNVIDFVEFLKKFSRILSILDMKKCIPLNKEEIQDFNSKLSELCNAIEDSDSVLVGDLLEYEIVPVVENILSGV